MRRAGHQTKCCTLLPFVCNQTHGLYPHQHLFDTDASFSCAVPVRRMGQLAMQELLFDKRVRCLEAVNAIPTSFKDKGPPIAKAPCDPYLHCYFFIAKQELLLDKRVRHFPHGKGCGHNAQALHFPGLKTQHTRQAGEHTRLYSFGCIAGAHSVFDVCHLLRYIRAQRAFCP